MIRRGRASDLPAMIRMAKAFHAEAKHLHGLPFSPAFSGTTFNAALASGSGYIGVLDINGPKGALIAQVCPFPLGPALVAKEVVFWIAPEFRGHWWRKMIGEYEVWAKDMGAVIAGLSCFGDGRTHRIFSRLGYEVAENNLVKVL